MRGNVGVNDAMLDMFSHLSHIKPQGSLLLLEIILFHEDIKI
jgi:hypothetical protein